MWAALQVIASGALGAQTIPHTFNPGGVIRASELNDNFRAVAMGATNNNTNRSGIRVVDTRTKRVLGILLDMELYTAGFDLAYSVLTPSNYILLLPYLAPYTPSNGADVTTDVSQQIDLYYVENNCAGSAHVPDNRLPYLRINYNNIVISDGTNLRFIRGDRAARSANEMRSFKERASGICKIVNDTSQIGTTRLHALFPIPTGIDDFLNIPTSGRIGIELTF
jgi:hypothetical protein